MKACHNSLRSKHHSILDEFIRSVQVFSKPTVQGGTTTRSQIPLTRRLEEVEAMQGPTDGQNPEPLSGPHADSSVYSYQGV